MGDQLVQKLNEVFVKLGDRYFLTCFSKILNLETVKNGGIQSLSRDLHNKFTAQIIPPNNTTNTIKIIHSDSKNVKNLYFDLSNGIGETNSNKLISIIIILILFYAVENIDIYLLPYLNGIFNSKTDLFIEDLYKNIDRKAIFFMINNSSASANGSLERKGRGWRLFRGKPVTKKITAVAAFAEGNIFRTEYCDKLNTALTDVFPNILLKNPADEIYKYLGLQNNKFFALCIYNNILQLKNNKDEFIIEKLWSQYIGTTNLKGLHPIIEQTEKIMRESTNIVDEEKLTE